jgi:hypothetical protein
VSAPVDSEHSNVLADPAEKPNSAVELFDTAAGASVTVGGPGASVSIVRLAVAGSPVLPAVSVARTLNV